MPSHHLYCTLPLWVCIWHPYQSNLCWRYIKTRSSPSGALSLLWKSAAVKKNTAQKSNYCSQNPAHHLSYLSKNVPFYHSSLWCGSILSWRYNPYCLWFFIVFTNTHKTRGYLCVQSCSFKRIQKIHHRRFAWMFNPNQ